MNTIYLGALRHAAQAFAGALVTKGIVGSDAQELVVGAVVSLATLGWYLIGARKSR